MGLLAHGFRPLVSLAVCFLAGGTYLGGAIAAFSLWSWYVELVGPFSTIIFAYVFVTTAKHFTEERKAREVRAMFSRYVTERVVNELISNPGLAKLGGTRRETTVLFADIRDFTRFSEKHSAEEVVSMLNEYLAEMTDIVFRWEGTLDKFIGDAIVAFWGAPLAQENHAELALRCSLNMIRKMEEMTDRWTIEGREALQIGIGLNTGEVIVGNIGAENKKMDYTVIGDHVNLGARVEALNKKYGSHILITEFTLESVRDLVASGRFGHLAIQGMDRVVVKGKENPVQVFQLVPREPGCETTLTECPETIVYQKEK
jgi:adenylate cyclase